MLQLCPTDGAMSALFTNFSHVRASYAKQFLIIQNLKCKVISMSKDSLLYDKL